MSDVALACRDIVAGYGDVEVLHGVSLDVRPGMITALLGNNGAGKTTLMRTIAGVLPARRGSLLYLGRPIEQLGASDRVAAGIALVPEGRLVFPDLSVADNLRLGAYTPRARKDRSARVDKMYDDVSAACRAALANGRRIVGRRAADAGAGARPDVGAYASAP